MSIIDRIYGDIDRLLTGYLEADRVEVNGLRISERRFNDDEAQFISVPGDYPTVNDAIQDVFPYRQMNTLVIEVSEDTNEDIYIPPCITKRIPDDVGSEDLQIEIRGDGSTPAVNSIFADTVMGMGLSISDFEVTGVNPYSNESAAVELYGCKGRVQVLDLTISGTTTTPEQGIISYSSDTTVGGTISIPNGTQFNGLMVKHGGTAYISGDITGSVGAYIARGDSGTIRVESEQSATFGQSVPYDGVNGGTVVAPGHTYGSRGQVLERTNQTISSGEISASSGFIKVSGEGGAADNLTTINGGVEGMVVTLHFEDSITVEHATGNIRLDGASNVTLDNLHDTLTLVYNSLGNWTEKSRANTTP